MTVFEISNTERKEFYLCASAKPLLSLMREHCDHPPAAIAHWKKDEGVFYNEVDTLPGFPDVEAFMTHYAEVLLRTGWTVLSEPR
jgi:hypothetical protein